MKRIWIGGPGILAAVSLTIAGSGISLAQQPTPPVSAPPPASPGPGATAPPAAQVPNATSVPAAGQPAAVQPAPAPQSQPTPGTPDQAPVQAPAQVPGSTAPPASASPPATAPVSPQGATPPADQTAPAGNAAGQQLPDVDVIQAQPEPPPPAAETPPPPKIVKKKPEAPEPAPVAAAPPVKPKPQPVQQAAPAEPQPVAEQTPQAAPPLTTEIKLSPVGGSEIPLSKVTSSVGRATAEDIKRTGATSPQDVLQTSVPGVIVTDLQGNGFQTNVQYRGFESSPVNGVPQGLAVYQNGVRINEAFGDIVNWDFLPSNAIQDMTVLSGNPVFGLNAIGGAISIGMKDGFKYQGSEVDVRGGSFGRIQESFETGQRSGAVAAYLALEAADDDGWRDNSPSRIRRMYTDLGYKTDDIEWHINFTGAKNFVGAVTAAPVELLALDYARTYTSPQLTNNDVKMVSTNGTVNVSDTLKISGVAYHRTFKQRRKDANAIDAGDCVAPGGTPGNLCIEGEEAADANGQPIAFDPAIVYGSIDNTGQDAKSFGFAVQAVDKSKLFGLGNQFLIGTSYDRGKVLYGANSVLGQVAPGFVINPIPGIPGPISAPDDVSPRSLATTNDYFGIYVTDTLDVTDQLSVTAGGRFNYAKLSIRDLTGVDPFLNGDSSFSRFNPLIGGTYALMPGVSLFGSYSEANRAPTPAELACADPNNPCLIESFLTADPPLKQVVSHTAEIGLRGEDTSWNGRERIDWGLGLFRTLNSDDIISVAAPTSGRGFFQNAGDTLRQGIEVSGSYRSDRIFLYANYNYVRATFDTPIAELPSPNTPSPNAFDCTGSDPADPVSCVSVEKGDRLPGIPAHKFKAGFDYWMTPQWKFGADLIASSSQVFEGDQGNDNRRLAGYAKINLHTSYDVTEKIQIYGLIDNLFDTRYGLFGNYFDLETASAASLGTITFTDPRTVVPGAPFAVYGGVKVKF